MSKANPLKCYFRGPEHCGAGGGNPYFSLIAKKLVERFSPKTALDIGCADGVLVHAFRKLGVETYGVDFSQYLLSCEEESVRGYLSQIDVDFEPLPFERENFDLVVAHQVLQHLQRPGYAISEMWRVLRAGGNVFVCTPTPPWDQFSGKSRGFRETLNTSTATLNQFGSRCLT